MEPSDYLRKELIKLEKDLDNAKNHNGVMYDKSAHKMANERILKLKKAIEILNWNNL